MRLLCYDEMQLFVLLQIDKNEISFPIGLEGKFPFLFCREGCNEESFLKELIEKGFLNSKKEITDIGKEELLRLRSEKKIREKND